MLVSLTWDAKLASVTWVQSSFLIDCVWLFLRVRFSFDEYSSKMGEHPNISLPHSTLGTRHTSLLSFLKSSLPDSRLRNLRFFLDMRILRLPSGSGLFQRTSGGTRGPLNWPIILSVCQFPVSKRSPPAYFGVPRLSLRVPHPSLRVPCPSLWVPRPSVRLSSPPI